MDFSKICRTCLVEDGAAVMQSVFAFDDDHQFSAMIAACSATEVTHHDGLPEQLCLPCCAQLRSCLAFKTKCETSYETLQLLRDTMTPTKDNTNAQKLTPPKPPVSSYRKFDKYEKFVQSNEVTFYLCEMCDMKFVSEEALKLHRPIHHGNGFKCRVCSSMFGRLTHLRRHIESVHTTSELYANVCTICDRRFLRSDTLQRHMLTHADVDDCKAHNLAILDDADDCKAVAELWQCSECALFFGNSQELEAHGLCTAAAVGNETKEKEEYIIEELHEEEELKPIEIFERRSRRIENQEKHEFKNESEDDDEDKPDASALLYRDDDYIPAELTIERSVSDSSDHDDACDPATTPEPLRRGRGRPRKSLSVSTPPASKRGRNRKSISPHPDQPADDAEPPEDELTSTTINQCPKCPKSFARATHLKRHLIVHSSVKPFACDVCDKRFTRLDHLKIHRHHHMPVKPHNCDICQRGFTRADHLEKHKTCRHQLADPLSKTNSCEMCQKSYSTVKALQTHMKLHLDREFVCKFCTTHYATKDELADHHAKMHAHEKPFLCSECGVGFVRNDYLTIHMRRHKGDKPYKCRYCDKGFPRSTDLTVHERYHTGEKTHLCTTCGKGFHRAYNLLVHMRVHTGERPYQCPHCERSFAQCNDLKTHVRRHTGERFKCDVCGEGFIQVYHLTQHKKKMHGIEVQSHIQRVEKFVTAKQEDGSDASERLEEMMVEEVLVDDEFQISAGGADEFVQQYQVAQPTKKKLQRQVGAPRQARNKVKRLDMEPGLVFTEEITGDFVVPAEMVMVDTEGNVCPGFNY